MVSVPGDQQLAVLLGGRQVGTLTQERAGGRHVFVYDADPGDLSLSLSMPVQAGRGYSARVVDAYLEGLLTDSRAERERLGRRFGVSSRNPFALLAHIGKDCAGAVQFCAPAEVDDVLARRGELVPVDEKRIGERLRRLRQDSAQAWSAPGEAYSLGGAQSKFALRRTTDGWAEAHGAEPTTHIIKTGIDRYRLQALNEHICQRAATLLGLPAANTEYVEFDGEPAIVIERYDRAVLADGTVSRIHQEDLCQALGVRPAAKYESDGGPSAVDVLDLLATSATPESQPRFVAYLAFMSLINAPDGHAKNHSIMHTGLPTLAPLYDVASSAPYEYDPSSDLNKMAMSIGGAWRFDQIREAQWSRLAERSGVDETLVLGIVRDIATDLPDALRDAIHGQDMPPDARDLGDRLLPRVAALCASALSSSLNPGRTAGP
ncbi:MAG: type II toxin-antitoxin system HipA family toxin [Actinomycetia bacterium]|nr:type II toxin-antitoxin system HipA family toxin [Actinomycetes bacterium]